MPQQLDPTIRKMLERHLKQLAKRIQSKGVYPLRRMYRAARNLLAGQLLSVTDPSTPTSLQLNAMLQQIDRAITFLGGDVSRFLNAASRGVIDLGILQTSQELKKLKKFYTGTEPVVDLDVPAVFAGLEDEVNSSLLRRHRLTSRTWAVSTISSMEHALSAAALAGADTTTLIREVSKAGGIMDGERYRAERIVRTEMAYAHNAAKHRAMQETAQETGERMYRKLLETFDDRTGDDSFVLHGQVVPVDEPFTWRHKRGGQWVTAKYMFPPNRPNDRAVVIPWDLEWEAEGHEAPLTLSELQSAPSTRWRKTSGVEVPPGHEPGKPYV